MNTRITGAGNRFSYIRSRALRWPSKPLQPRKVISSPWSGKSASNGLSCLSRLKLGEFVKFDNLEIVSTARQRPAWIRSHSTSPPTRNAASPSPQNNTEDENERRGTVSITEPCSPVALSQHTAEKLGFDEISLHSKTNIDLPTSWQGVGKKFMLEFDQECQRLPDTGILCSAQVLNRLAIRFPDISGSATLIKSNLSSGVVDNAAKFIPIDLANFRFNTTGPGSIFVEVRFHLKGPWKLKVKSTTASMSRVDISLGAAYLGAQFSTSHGPLPPSFEDRIITQMAATTVEKLCAELTFESFAAIPAYFSKALLEVIRFPSPALDPRRTRVGIHYRVNWKKEYQSAGADARSTFEPGSTIFHPAKPRHHEQRPRLERGNEAQQPLDDADDSPTFELQLNARDNDEKLTKTSDGNAKASPPPEMNEAVSVTSKPEHATAVHGPSPDDHNVVSSTERSTDDCGEKTANPNQKQAQREIFIALGSNVGNRLENIENACREIDADPDMTVKRTSHLYETEPMYVEDQDRFLNGACEISTTLPPMELLDRLQAIEQKLGRVKLIEKGPRNIDLDMILYRKKVIDNKRLQVPHLLMPEREFVLRPLVDLGRETLSDSQVKHLGVSNGDTRELLEALPPQIQPLIPVTPLIPGVLDLRIKDPKSATQIMAILNTTPDSFSDGGAHKPTDIEHLKQAVSSLIAAGATIIDIGGQSSRPNAPDVTAEEEIARILPAIEAVKACLESDKVAISIDTYRAAVAEAAVNAGAHIINDISAGQLDSEMLPTIARLGCTYVMMHMRGTPSTMQSEENTSYPAGLLPTITNELVSRLGAAQEAGIRRWRLILDPGIGFSKTPAQNLELLRCFRELRASHPLFANCGWLIGSSRKSFIGKVTGVEAPAERIWGTATTVTAAVQGGAEMVRVHDVGEMAKVVKMADAIYRV